MTSKTPAYNLKAVLQETGLAADTLRAWERRYGLPTPNRTAGGHRLYSQHDIETIKWLIERQAEGLSISRAVELWNEQTASGANLLAGTTPSAITTLQAVPATFTTDTTLDAIRAEWISACINFNEMHAEQALNKAFSIFPVEAVCMEILQKGMAEIGGLWYENNVSVQQEHFASGLAMRRLDSLLSASPAPSRNQTVIIGCPPNEWHTFTPLLLSLLLRRRGLNVIYLGANIPADQFAETVSTVHANMVILVAQTLITAAALQLTALTLTNLKIPIGFGGRIFNLLPNLLEQIPGNYLGDTVDASLEKVEKLLKTKSVFNTFKAASPQYVSAHRAFVSKRTHIESTIKELIAPFGVSAEGINTGIQFLGDNITAALQLGNMEHVSDEMEWVKMLMKSHERPQEELAYFMKTYSQSIDKHINGKGEPIKKWLNAHAQG